MNVLKALTKRFAAILVKLLVVALGVAIFLQPEFHVLAPLLDLIGVVGLDGLLVMIEVQTAIWLFGPFRRHLIPVLTAAWNRHGAPRLGLAPSEDILVEAVMSFFHTVLCKGGATGALIYIFYIGICHHINQYAPPMA
jgi:hypothetical protein